MALGPKGMLVLTKEDCIAADGLEEEIDAFLKAMTESEGEDGIFIPLKVALPNIAVQGEIERRYTSGKDPWSAVRFERGEGTGRSFIVLVP